MALHADSRNRDATANVPALDPAGWVSLVAGLLIVLITFFTSYSHVDLFGFLRF